MQTRQVHEIRMACLSEEAAQKVSQYDPHLAGDIIHVVTADGIDAVIRFADPAWPISVAESALNDGHATAQEASRIIALCQAADSKSLAPATASWEQKEKSYLALLNLAPQFDLPCRPGGALRDITVSKHRNGPDSPWQWAIHRSGCGLVTEAWDGKQWWIVDRPVRLLEYAVWDNPMAALVEAQRIAKEDEARGYTDADRSTD